MKKGILYLIPSSLGSDQPADQITPSVMSAVNELNELVVEDEKTARRFLRSIGMKRPFEEIRMQVLNEHVKRDAIARMLAPALAGKNMGLMSDAGCPGVADPGSELVKMAHDKGVKVVPLSGPSSILLALMASGLNGQQFAFRGYLPRDRHDRISAIRKMESAVLNSGTSQIFMDTPYRNMHVLEDLLNECKPQTCLCIAANLTCADEFVQTRTVGEWKATPPAINKVPVMFILGR